jgi:hypothetical protein
MLEQIQAATRAWRGTLHLNRFARALQENLSLSDLRLIGDRRLRPGDFPPGRAVASLEHPSYGLDQ